MNIVNKYITPYLGTAVVVVVVLFVISKLPANVRAYIGQ
jgi:hypothetical protein